MNNYSKYTVVTSRNKVFVLATLLLIIGGLVYILLRPSELLFFSNIKNQVIANWIDSVRNYSVPVGELLPDWFVYSLPNGLWAFAYTAIITGIWHSSKSLMKYFWYGTIPVLIFGFEFFQLTNLLPGTFSIQDFIFALFGIVIGLLINKKTKKTINHEKEIK